MHATTPHNPAHNAGPRFLCTQTPLAVGQTVSLDPDEARHATRVLRLSEGDRVQLLDGRGHIACATLTSVNPKQTRCTIEQLVYHPPPCPSIQLATAIPKGPRADALVNDLAQLGTDRFIPLQTARTVVQPREHKLERFNKAAAEAAKQSGNPWFMQVDPMTAYADALHATADLKLIADPYADKPRDLTQRVMSAKVIRVLIGPEGGLTEEECLEAKHAGFVPWRFSDHVLRIETAAAAAVAILRAQA